jgi:hypothetical protein
VKQAVAAFVLAMVMPLPATGQTPAPAAGPQTYTDIWGRRIAEIARLRDAAPLNMAEQIGGHIDVASSPTGFFLFAHAANIAPELRLVEDARTDKQIGGPAATAGSTSLVSRGAVPAVLAFAVENGALTQTADATTVTVRGNAVGWLDLLQGQDFIAGYEDDARLTRILRAVSYSFTFNATSNDVPETAVRPTEEQLEERAKASWQQLASFSVRVALIDQRDPRRAVNRAAVASMMDIQGVNLLAAVRPFNTFFRSVEYTRWREETIAVLTAPGSVSQRDLERLLYRRLEALRQLMAADVPNFDAEVATFVSALESFDSARDGVFRAIAQRFVLAAEYVRSRPALAPASSTFRVIADGRPGNTRLDLTANIAVTYQDDGVAMVPAPKETGGVRDFQLAFQAELPYGKQASSGPLQGLGRPVIALELLSRKLFEPAVVNFGGHDFAVEPGWIHAAQAKVTIPVKGSGVKVPFSVSIANRTELIAEKNVRAHLGVTFDLDVLAAAVRR